MFIHQGSVADGDEFFERFWPEARAVSDPQRAIYDAFGVGKGSVGQLMGLRSLSSAMRAWRKGYRQGRAVGDVRVLSGVFAVRRASSSGSLVRGEVVWQHIYDHAGDHPDFAVLARFGESDRATSSGESAMRDASGS